MFYALFLTQFSLSSQITLCGAWFSVLPQRLSSKESTCNAGATEDAGSITGLGGSPGRGHGNPFQYSCLENPKDRGAWQAIVHRVAKSRTWLKQLSTPTYRCVCLCVCVCVCVLVTFDSAVSPTPKCVHLTTLLSYWICSNCFLLICPLFIYLLKIVIEGQGSGYWGLSRTFVLTEFYLIAFLYPFTNCPFLWASASSLIFPGEGCIKISLIRCYFAYHFMMIQMLCLKWHILSLGFQDWLMPCFLVI